MREWVEKGRGWKLASWLERELDGDGVPRRLSVPSWGEGLRLLAEGRDARSGEWPEEFDVKIEGMFRATLRFSRPGGGAVFGEGGARPGVAALYRGWADRLSEPGFTTVLDWWFPHPGEWRHAPPPLPADSRPDRVLGMLRANWTKDGDLVGVDHRGAGSSTGFELWSQGRAWLGPKWGMEMESAEGLAVSRAKPTAWVSHSSADMLEWTFRVGPATVTRTAVLLRGRRLAVLGEQWEGPGDPGEVRVGLPEWVETSVLQTTRGLSLTARGGRGSLAVIPLGLACFADVPERGSLGRERDCLVLREPSRGGARAWRSLLVSWDPARNRKRVQWKGLTISEDYKRCEPGTAFAARATWGRDDTLVVYRSLTAPAIRAFLGHQTRARFLIGLFTKEGEVEPLLRVAETAEG